MLQPVDRSHDGAYRRLAGWHGELTAFRRDLHAHPELAFEERRTAVLRELDWLDGTRRFPGELRGNLHFAIKLRYWFHCLLILRQDAGHRPLPCSACYGPFPDWLGERHGLARL